MKSTIATIHYIGPDGGNWQHGIIIRNYDENSNIYTQAPGPQAGTRRELYNFRKQSMQYKELAGLEGILPLENISCIVTENEDVYINHANRKYSFADQAQWTKDYLNSVPKEQYTPIYLR